MPSEVRFAIVRQLLESAGYRMRKKKGPSNASHVVFVKADRGPVNVPLVRGRFVKPYYVKQAEKAAAAEGRTEEGSAEGGPPGRV